MAMLEKIGAWLRQWRTEKPAAGTETANMRPHQGKPQVVIRLGGMRNRFEDEVAEAARIRRQSETRASWRKTLADLERPRH